jgi:enamine deaminase RidA (YjgF/YER057c/UK114 family)
MTIKRHEPSKIYSKVVEANGFVFTAGIVADDIKQDAKGQTQQILKEIDRLLKVGGTDKTKVVSATIWVTDIRHRDPMNEAWNAWTGGENARPRLALRPSWPTRACWLRRGVAPSAAQQASVRPSPGTSPPERASARIRQGVCWREQLQFSSTGRCGQAHHPAGRFHWCAQSQRPTAAGVPHCTRKPLPEKAAPVTPANRAK